MSNLRIKTIFITLFNSEHIVTENRCSNSFMSEIVSKRLPTVVLQSKHHAYISVFFGWQASSTSFIHITIFSLLMMQNFLV